MHASDFVMYISNMAGTAAEKVKVAQDPSKPHLPVALETLYVNVLCCNWATLTDWNYDLFHPFWRVYWMERPGWYVLYGSKALPLTPANLVVIPPHTRCLSQSRARATQLYIHFTLEPMVKAFTPGVYFIPAKKAFRDRIRSLNPLSACGPADAISNMLNVKSLCYDCLCHLPDSSRLICKYSPKVMMAMQEMAEHPGHPFSNQAFAKIAGMSVNGFIREFKREVGIPPQRWQMEYRINAASLMLLHDAKSIDEIAEVNGFYDRAHFSKVFRRYRHCGPATYRKRHGT